MAAPSTPVLDTFSGTLANWTNPAWNAGAMAISGGVVVGTAAAQTAMGWTAPFAAGNGLECFCTLPNGLSNGAESSLRMEHALSNGHGYTLIFSNATSTYDIRRYSDDFTQVSILTGSRAITAGDKVGIQRIGAAINLWHFTGGAWVLFDTTNDPTYTDLAYIGIGDYNAINTYDDFGGGVPILPLVTQTEQYPIMSNTSW